MWILPAEVVQNQEVAPRHFVMRLQAADIAQRVSPGQFIQVRCGDIGHPLLPRPFSIMRCNAADGTIEILYRQMGAGTRMLARAMRGQWLTLWGPLGNGFWNPPAMQHIIVGGGVGIPPLLMLLEDRLRSGAWSVTDVRVLLGARTASEVLCATDFQSFGMGIGVATDDGSWGHHGFVTDLLQLELQNVAALYGAEQTCVYACGPPGMLKASAALAIAAGIPCQVCLEAPMPCGVGVCMGCVVATRPVGNGCGTEPGETGLKYQRVCREGPVFDAREVVWD